MPCFTEAEVAEAHERIAMQQALGLDVRWLDPGELDELNPAMATGQTLGGSYAPGDGYLDPPAQRARLHRGARRRAASTVRRADGVHRAPAATAGGCSASRTTGRRRSPPSGWC